MTAAGCGCRPPGSVQYWDGSTGMNVTGPSSYPTADNTFNAVTFDSVTTTKLRVVMQSGLGSVGAIQWIVPSVAAGGSATAAGRHS